MVSIYQKVLLLTCVAWTQIAGASAECRMQERGSVWTETHHFASTPPIHPDALDFQLADLGNGAQELIQGGYQVGVDDLSYSPSISLLLARDRIDDLAYRTRAALPFLNEYLVSATPSSGDLFGAPGPVVLVVTRAKYVQETRVRVVDGVSWSSPCYYFLPVYATAAVVAPDTSDGPLRLFLQDADAIHVYSLPDLTEIRTLTSAGGTGFAMGQLDDDPAQEIIVAATPGRIVDAVSGAVEWEYAPGFFSHVASGNFGLNSHAGFVAMDYSGTNIFSASPYQLVWSVPQEEFIQNSQQFTIADVNGDQRDDLLVAGGYRNGSQYVYSIRVFDALTQELMSEIPEPSYDQITGFKALPGRSTGSIEIVEGMDADTVTSVKSRNLESPSEEWDEYTDVGPFAAFSMGDFIGDGSQEVVFAGRGAAHLHVLDSIEWLETGSSPLHSVHSIGVGVQDIVGVHSQSPAVHVAIGGTGFFGAISNVNVADWTVNWQFGIANDPNDAPLGDRTVQKMLVYDFNHDGVEDLIAGASEYGGSTIGALVGIFDGSNGNELWHSDPLGGFYAHVSDMQVSIRGGDPDDILLVAATDGVHAFGLSDGAQLWTLQQQGVALTQMDAGVAIASVDGPIRAFDTNQVMQWETGAHGPADAIAQPLANGPLLVSSSSRLRWLDRETGAQIGVSGPVAPSFAVGNRWLLRVRNNQQSLEVIAGSDAGMFDVNIGFPLSDEIFYDGFE